MLSLVRAVVAAFAFAVVGSASTYAAEEVGEAVVIKTTVTGDSGELLVKSPVHKDERIQTSITGLGQFVFRDGTKLAVGWGSSVVIDQYVFNDANSVQKLTITAAKGTFRWISGNSEHSAYEIVTPAGTIGVRGTAFDFFVGEDGTTGVVLISGAVQFCSSTGCKELTRGCDAVIASPAGDVTDPRRANRGMLNTLGTSRALPFLTGNQALTKQFRANDRACRLVTASLHKKVEPTKKAERTKKAAPAIRTPRTRTADAKIIVRPPKHSPPDVSDDDDDDDDDHDGHDHGNNSHDGEHGHHGHDDDHGQD